MLPSSCWRTHISRSLMQTFPLLANGANAYALPYVQEITDVPLQSSGFDVFDEDIPFYQMVMHGVKSYGTSAVNASATPEETVLRHCLRQQPAL